MQKVVVVGPLPLSLVQDPGGALGSKKLQKSQIKTLETYFSTTNVRLIYILLISSTTNCPLKWVFEVGLI
jgi:hypothetical protein